MPRFWKLTPLIALATVVALLVAGLLLAVSAERTYRAQKIDEATVEAQILAATVTAALDFKDRDAAQEYVDALKANPEIEAAAVYDADGAPVASYSRTPGAAAPDRAGPEGARLAEGRLTIVAPVTEAGQILGRVYLRNVTEPLTQRLERYGGVALLIVMATLVVGILGVAQRDLARVNAELVRRAVALASANENLQRQIEQREKAEAALRQAQKMEAIGQLTGGVAHDFNNLLQVILGNLGAMQLRVQQGRVSLGEDSRRLIDAAIRGGERAASLTQRLLAFSRLQPLDPKPVDVNKLVAGMSDLLHRTIGESIRVETVLAGGLWRVSADANQLEAALLNLAVNARDAMPGGGKLTIETANSHLDEAYASTHDEVRAGQYVVVCVTDTGTGMTKEVLGKAFDPFFTTKDVGQGTGLGLSQVYGFVKQSGGHVKIYSEPGDGTTLKLYLPRLASAEEHREEAEPTPPMPKGAADDVILVVEDDPEVRALTVEMLRELGYAVIETVNGDAALAALATAPAVRLLFTDVGLPGGLNGRQLADEARRRRPDLKVLYTTGYARNAIVHHGRLDPGVQLIAKPFTYAALARSIRQVLES